MENYINLKDAERVFRNGVMGYTLLTEAHGCTNGCCTGVSVFSNTEYPKVSRHEDQEGFMVLEGTGWARVGEEEIPLEPETSFIVPAGVGHAVKKNPDSKPIKIFWFHAGI